MSIARDKKKAAHLERMIRDLNDIVEQTYYFENRYFDLKNKIECNKRKISKVLGSRSSLNCKVDKDLSFSVNKSVKPRIKFYEDQLRSNLKKDIYNKIVKKTVVVDDLDGLVKLMKDNGVKPSQFKKFIRTIDEVETDSIDNLLDIGDITLEDLQGSYEVEFDEEIRIRKNK